MGKARFLLSLLLWAFFISGLGTSPLSAASLNAELYHTSKLPAEIQSRGQEYEKMRKEQKRRRSDLEGVKKEIEGYRVRIGNNPRKNKDAAQALEKALARQKVLEQKIAQYDPVLKQKYQEYQVLSRTLVERKKELSLVPNGDLSGIAQPEALRARPALKSLLERANLQLQHYKKAFQNASSSSASMRERANMRNFITQLEEEVKIRRRQFAQVSAAIERHQNQMEFDRQIAEQNDPSAEVGVPRKPARPSPTRPAEEPPARTVAATPYPAFVFPSPVAIVESPPKNEDGLERLLRFLEDYAFACVFAFFIAAGLSTFLTIQIVDGDNERHHFFPPFVIGALTAIFFVLPFPGLFLGLTVFIICQPLYYRLPIEKLPLSLLLSVSLLAVFSFLLVGALAFFLIH